MEPIDDDAPIALAALRRWQPPGDHATDGTDDTATTDDHDETPAPPPFVFDAALNARVALWHGPIWRLAVDAVVNSTNESLTDTTGLCRKILDAAGKEIWTECASAGPCRTGEAVVTRGCGLPAAKLIHTVAPRFSVAYRSAAEHALHMCYRAALSAAVEHRLASVAFPCVYTKRKHYPRDDAAHVAARTVRRFLEHYRNELECVVFCVDSLEDQLTYEAVLPLYFPRSRREAEQSRRALEGRALGDAFGEPVILERKIRIAEFLSHQHSDDDDALSSTNQEDEDAALESFYEMSADPDVERLERLRRQQEQREQELRKAQQTQQRALTYQTALKQAQQHDWRDLTKRKFLYTAGVDHSGAPVVVYMASRLSVGGSEHDDRVDLDRVMLFIIQFMDAIVDKSYSVLYVHGDTASGSDETQLSAAWIKRLFKTFSSKYQQNLRFFYMYEPSMWLKLLVLVAKGFVSSAFYKKIVYLASPQDLAHVASALDVPHYMDPKNALPADTPAREHDNNQPATRDASEYSTVFPRRPEAIL